MIKLKRPCRSICLLRYFYEFKEKDDAKAAENYTKARENDPNK
jgi:hypothetical protein